MLEHAIHVYFTHSISNSILIPRGTADFLESIMSTSSNILNKIDKGISTIMGTVSELILVAVGQSAARAHFTLHPVAESLWTLVCWFVKSDWGSSRMLCRKACLVVSTWCTLCYSREVNMQMEEERDMEDFGKHMKSRLELLLAAIPEHHFWLLYQSITFDMNTLSVNHRSLCACSITWWMQVYPALSSRRMPYDHHYQHHPAWIKN